MHSDWFNGIDILQGKWQHGEKVGYCNPSGLEKTLSKWDIICTAGHEGVNRWSESKWGKSTILGDLWGCKFINTKSQHVVKGQHGRALSLCF
jgi:hypothetical protein